MKKLLLIPMLFFTNNPQEINERKTIEGVLINVTELQRWVNMDYQKNIIDKETASMYYSLLEVTINQLKSIQNDKQKN